MSKLNARESAEGEGVDVRNPSGVRDVRTPSEVLDAEAKYMREGIFELKKDFQVAPEKFKAFSSYLLLRASGEAILGTQRYFSNHVLINFFSRRRRGDFRYTTMSCHDRSCHEGLFRRILQPNAI